jgi:multisubunit Na+/H+ antiporter MnhB subunit
VALPLLGELKLASATLFDAGVYLVVVGTVLEVLARLADVRPEANA